MSVQSRRRVPSCPPYSAPMPMRSRRYERARGDGGRIVWSPDTVFHRRARWVALIAGLLAFGGLGWWLAGPVLAGAFACWPVWRTLKRWKGTARGLRYDDEGFDVLDQGVPVRRVDWRQVTQIDVQRREPGPGWEHLVEDKWALLPLVPVVMLADGAECVLWPLAVEQHEKIDRIDKAEQTGLALLAEWDRAKERAADRAVRSG